MTNEDASKLLKGDKVYVSALQGYAVVQYLSAGEVVVIKIGEVVEVTVNPSLLSFPRRPLK